MRFENLPVHGASFFLERTGSTWRVYSVCRNCRKQSDSGCLRVQFVRRILVTNGLFLALRCVALRLLGRGAAALFAQVTENIDETNNNRILRQRSVRTSLGDSRMCVLWAAPKGDCCAGSCRTGCSRLILIPVCTVPLSWECKAVLFQTHAVSKMPATVISSIWNIIRPHLNYEGLAVGVIIWLSSSFTRSEDC